MTVPEYRDLAQKAALRVGPAFIKVYVIYAIFSAVLLYFSLQMQQRVMVWQDTVRQFILAGDPELPPITTEVLCYFGLAFVLLILAQVLKAGWFTIVTSSRRTFLHPARKTTRGRDSSRPKILSYAHLLDFGWSSLRTW